MTKKPIQRSTRGELEITHSEFVREVRGLVDNVLLQSDLITPNNHSLFPWLSRIALNYETFKFKKLKFRYEPKCATTNYGAVSFAVDWDPTDIPSPDLQQVLMMEGAVSSNIWKGFSLVCPPQYLDKKETLYTSTGDSEMGSRLTDLGRFILYIDRLSTNDVIGNLWVDYTVTLRRPQPPDERQRQLTIVSSSIFGEVVPTGSARFYGGLSIVKQRNVSDKLIFKQNFQGIVWFRAQLRSHTSGAPIRRPHITDITGTWRALRLIDMYVTGVIGNHCDYIFLVMTGPSDRRPGFSISLSGVKDEPTFATLEKVITRFIPAPVPFMAAHFPSDTQTIDGILQETVHDYVPWNAPPERVAGGTVPYDYDYPL